MGSGINVLLADEVVTVSVGDEDVGEGVIVVVGELGERVINMLVLFSYRNKQGVLCHSTSGGIIPVLRSYTPTYSAYYCCCDNDDCNNY